MHVELLKHWNGYKPGKRFPEMPEGAGNVLVRRGLAIEVAIDGRAETAAARPPKLKRAERKPGDK